MSSKPNNPSRSRRRATPTTRTGWFGYYVARYNKTEDPQALHLAMWYLLLALAESDGAL